MPSDEVMVSRLLEHHESLTDYEATAFRNMEERAKPLTVKQREWVTKVYRRNHLHHEYANAAAPRNVRKSKAKLEHKGPYWWERPENHPLRPPGRV
jgi:hypothetical protein